MRLSKELVGRLLNMELSRESWRKDVEYHHRTLNATLGAGLDQPTSSERLSFASSKDVAGHLLDGSSGEDCAAASDTKPGTSVSKLAMSVNGLFINPPSEAI